MSTTTILSGDLTTTGVLNRNLFFSHFLTAHTISYFLFLSLKKYPNTQISTHTLMMQSGNGKNKQLKLKGRKIVIKI